MKSTQNKNSVYPPSEDSFLLAETTKHLKGKILDMGTGPGFIAITNALLNPSNQVTAVDINPKALFSARENAEKKNLNIHFIESDLFSNLKGRFDYILFNPPYLPSKKTQELALDGGKEGSEIILRFLEQAKNFLSPEGNIFLLLSSFNNPEKLKKKAEQIGYTLREIKRKNLFFETLYVWKLSKNNV
ncbi:methyltransferase [Candidatus Micrarchaeota archaeon]|nr:methyltransferase [Candidatus Micrarchaeota archaeon]